VFQTELEVLLFHPVDKHTPSPKIEIDIEFPNMPNARQFPGKNPGNWSLREIETTNINPSELKLGQGVLHDGL
jgi:hypothetical protein